MDDVSGQVGQLLLVDPCCVAQDIPLPGREQDVLVHGVVHPVDGGLAFLHHVNVPEASRAVLLHEQRVEHKRIPAVVVESPFGQCRVVLAGVEHHAVAELAVVQHAPALRRELFVVPVYHDALAAGVEAAVVDVAGHIEDAGGVPCQLRPALFQLVRVRQTQREEMGRRLNVVHARLPVEHQQVHGPDADLAHAAPLLRVPEHPLDAGALLELAPPCVAVHLLVVGLFQHYGQNAGKRLCRSLIVLGPGQDIGAGVVVHRVSVLVGDGVEQPPAGRLGLALHHGVLVVLPVPHPEPQLVIHQALVQRRLACLVPLQDLCRLAHLLRPDGRLFSHLVQFNSFLPSVAGHFRFCPVGLCSSSSDLPGLPTPLPLGEVALRSNDGEGKPVSREPPHSDKQSFC